MQQYGKANNMKCFGKVIKENKLLSFGLLITIPYLLWIIERVFYRQYDQFISLKLNELGDLLAGIFGPLAFLWLVIGYIQQSRELRLQVTELKNSVVHQEKMAGAYQRQVQLDELERDEKKKQNEPNFVCSGVSANEGTLKFVTIRLLNTGAIATELTIDPAPGVSVNIHPAHLVINGQCVNFKLTAANIKDMYGITVRIRYRNTEKHQVTDLWLLDFNETKNMFEFTKQVIDTNG